MLTSVRRIAAAIGLLATLGALFVARIQGAEVADAPFALGAARSPASRSAPAPTDAQLQQWMKPLKEIGLGINPPAGPLPADFAELLYIPDDEGVAHPRRLAPGDYTIFNWAPSGLWAQPAYFDDVILERYGQSHLPIAQPLISAAHFFGTLPMIPYKIGLDHTHDPIYTLGYYRPGSPTPCLRGRIPLERDAGLLEAGTWVALVFLLP